MFPPHPGFVSAYWCQRWPTSATAADTAARLHGPDDHPAPDTAARRIAVVGRIGRGDQQGHECQWGLRPSMRAKPPS